MVFAHEDLYRMPKGRILNRWWPGCDGSLMMFLALLRQREQAMFSREGSEQPVIFWAVLMTLWRALLSAALQPEYHAEMQWVSTLSTVY